MYADKRIVLLLHKKIPRLPLFLPHIPRPRAISKIGTLLFFLLCYNLNAQNADSLRTLLKAGRNDSTAVEVMLELCTVYWNTKPDSALRYANDAIALAREINYPTGVGRALNFIGIVYFYQADYKRTDEYLLQSIEFCKENKLKGPLAHALGNLGMSQEWQGNYILSMEYRLQGLQYAEEARDVNRKIKLLASIGQLYSLLKNLEMAEKFLQDAVDEAARNNIPLSPGQITSLASVYEKRHKYPEAIKFSLMSLEGLKASQDMNGVAVVDRNIGNYYLAMNEIDKAAPFVEEAYRLSLKLEDVNVKALITLMLAELRLSQNRPDESIHLAQEAMKKAEALNVLPRIRDSQHLLARAYSVQGNHRMANAFWKKAYSMNDSILGGDLTNAVANAQKGYELAKKQSQIDQLNMDAKIIDLQFKNERLTKNFLVVGIIIVVIVAFIVWYVFYLKTKLNRELRLSAELKATRSQINPHFIFNSLTAIQETVSSGRYDNAIRYLGDFSLLLRKILDTSYLSFVVLEEEIKTMDLYLKVESIRFLDMFTWEIKVGDEIDVSEIEIPAMLMQPFLENALRHGLLPKKDHRFLGLGFFVKGDRFICRIEDNGVGRANGLENKSVQDNDRVSRGNQLIADRISLLNLRYNLDAQLSIDDLFDEYQKPSGTRVEISFDYNTLRRDV